MLHTAIQEELIAGATGALVGDDEQTHDDEAANDGGYQKTSTATYSVKFLQHAPENGNNQLPLTPLPEGDEFVEYRPAKDHALKCGGGKRTTSSKMQKEVMLYLYNRQAREKITADPKDAIKV